MMAVKFDYCLLLFGSVCHFDAIACSILNLWFSGIALSCSRFYLSDRTQDVSCADRLSISCPSTCSSVPLGTYSWTISILRLSTPQATHWTTYNFRTFLCRWNPAFCWSFRPFDDHAAIESLNAIRTRRASNFLKLSDKTDLVLIRNPKRLARIQNFPMAV